MEDTVNCTAEHAASRQMLLQAIKDVSGNILTCAIFTMPDPRDYNLPEDHYDQLNGRLRCLLDAGYYVWFPSRRPGSEYEDIFIVYNISLEEAQRLGVEYKRKGIAWIRNVGNGISYQLLERPNGKSVFRKVCERTKVCDMDDTGVIFAEFGRAFDCHLPFFERTEDIARGILARHNEIVGRIVEINTVLYKHDAAWVQTHLHRLIEKGWSGRSQYESRGMLFSGYKKLCTAEYFIGFDRDKPRESELREGIRKTIASNGIVLSSNDIFDLSAFPKEMLQGNHVSYSPYRLSAVHGSQLEMDRNGDFLSEGLDRMAYASEAIDDITSHLPIDAGQFVVVNGFRRYVAVLVADIGGNVDIIRRCMSQYHFLQHENLPDVKLSSDGQEWVDMRFVPTERSTVADKI